MVELFCKIYNLIRRCEKMLTRDLGNKWRFHIYLYWMGLPFSNAPITSHTYVGKHTSLLIFNKKNKKNKKRSTSYHWSLFAKFHSLPLTSQVLISATKMMLSKQTDICLLVHPQKEIGQHLLNKLSEEYFSQLPLLVLKNTVYLEG